MHWLIIIIIIKLMAVPSQCERRHITINKLQQNTSAKPLVAPAAAFYVFLDSYADPACGSGPLKKSQNIWFLSNTGQATIGTQAKRHSGNDVSLVGR